MKTEFHDPGKVLQILRSLSIHARILVVGDIMFDRYLWGNVERISPEAPVPVVKLYKRSHMPGGAANVALNLRSLGFGVALAGFIGQDNEGQSLKKGLGEKGIEVDHILSLEGRSTITKTRVIGGHQQIVRVDDEDISSYPERDMEKLLSCVGSLICHGPDAVVLSDYGKGMLEPEVTKEIISLCKEKDIPVLVDPKGNDYSKYRGATAITPNQKEFFSVIPGIPENIDHIVESGNRLREELDLEFLLVTRGEKGMLLLDEEHFLEIPAQAREVFDVSGAGDTVVATLAGGLASGLDRDDSVRLANIAAGIAVGKVGTSPVEKGELLENLSKGKDLSFHDKIYRDVSKLLPKIERWRDDGRSIAFTNGCFDIIHSGHIMYLERSGQECDRLIVGVNSDSSVSRLKGSSRPVNPEEDRMSVLAALSCVDAVVLFDGDTPLELIKDIRPDVLLKGDDYREDEVVGAPHVKSWGGRVVLVPILEGRSTSGVIERIKNADSSGPSGK